MRIGYPCINNSIGCTANHTFRLASYSRKKLLDTVKENLDCLKKTLGWNLEHGIMFFRIGSSLVPFASHPVCKVRWQERFSDEFRELGAFVRKHRMRISMHPDQFIVINSKDKGIVKRSVKELEYHSQVLDAMHLDITAKVQLHVGGVYGDKESAVSRFVSEYKKLPAHVKRRLVIENDERCYCLKDCLGISRKTGVAVLFDSFHHECYNKGESFRQAVGSAAKTWKRKDGRPTVDYSSQKKGRKKGSHTVTINTKHFLGFIRETKGIDPDVMLEIKDKEKSALKAVEALRKKGKKIR
ncbi:UV DNA damage repair endonuclease UvsE [Candidatus Woesearchaeota archaeon]|nr:UV DNA damage repair endonuclease UvsE [Candidatus Woesearchaeota archaeon]